MGVQDIMGIVKSGKQAPAAIDLGIVSIDFRDDEKYRSKEQRERESKDQWIGRHVEDLQLTQIRSRLEDLLGEIVELRQICQDGLVKVGAVGKSLYKWKRHGSKG